MNCMQDGAQLRFVLPVRAWFTVIYIVGGFGAGGRREVLRLIYSVGVGQNVNIPFEIKSSWWT